MDSQKQWTVTEKLYSNKEVALVLGIGISTFRKWCFLLEQKGYVFHRDRYDRILFKEQDLFTFHKVKELMATKRYSLDTAVHEVVSGLHHMDGMESNLVREQFEQMSNSRLDVIEGQMVTLLDRMEKQELLNQELTERLEKQQQYIEMNIKARDRHLMKALRDIQETRMQVAAMTKKKQSRWSSISAWFSK